MELKIRSPAQIRRVPKRNGSIFRVGAPLHKRLRRDVRSGGAYRLVFRHPSFDKPMAFFGTYEEVTPNERLVWTNEESDQGAVTTVTFEENGGKTLVTLHELYPTEAALDEALAGSAEGLPEQFTQLDELLADMR